MSELRDLIYLIRGGRKSHFGTWVGFSPQIEVGRVERAFEELEANEKRIAELEAHNADLLRRLDASLDFVRRLLEMQMGTKANDQGIPPVTCDTSSAVQPPFCIKVHKIQEINSND